MSGGRVTIPNNVRKTIQNIKEITGNHSEDEIYAMLKECSMDPNETAQKLLLQDPFHEVKRKRDRKKENLIKESTEPRWKPGMQGRGNRGGRGNYSRHISNDSGGGRTAHSAKENGIVNKGVEEGAKPSIPQKSKETSVENDKKKIEASSITSSAKLEGPLPKVSPIEASKIPTGPVMSASKTPSPSAGVYLSEKDPILMPSQDSRLPVGTIRREVGSQRAPVDQSQDEIKSTALAGGSEVGSSSMQGKVGPMGEVQGVGKNVVSSSHVPFSIPRPSSNYNNRQQAIGPQKVGPSMEWKPKPTNPPVPTQVTGSGESTKVPVESQTPPPTCAPPNLDSKEDAASHEIEKKLKESLISDEDKHVIIPNHLHVPEAEKLGFCFGSFDGLNNNKTLASSSSNGPSIPPPVSDKTSEASSQEVDEEQSRNQKVDDHQDCPTSSSNVPENLSTEGDMSSNAGGPEYREPKQETSSSLPNPGHQYPPVGHTSPNFSFENNENQGRDGSHVPSFVVQQPFDPASYYAHFYRANAAAAADQNSDGRMSPFHSTGNVPVLSPQASQSSQEVGNSLMLSTTSPTAPTQTAGPMQSSIAVTQQPLPVFRQPPGVHLPHYPPNYIPYGPYFSPFYHVPPPALHQFLTNQQPPPGNLYPAPPSKYPLPQYKPGHNNTNSGHVGMPGGYGPYGGGAHPGSGGGATAGSNEDLGGSQFKENNNVYITGQQSEGPGVWIAGPGRDMSGLQASSFYNLPQGGQVAYTPTQPNHATFPNIYHHPAQPVTSGGVHPLAGPGVDMVGPAASVYQQPQPTQINWPNNY